MFIRKKRNRSGSTSVVFVDKSGGRIGLAFYDVTTLYFETDYGDELRKPGFSKDGKHSNPQILLGLLVSQDGYPLTPD